MTTTTRLLQSIKPATRNPKDHDLGELCVSLTRFGFVGSLLVDSRTDRLLAGHGRFEALQQLRQKGTRPAGIELDSSGDWIVPVELWASKNDAEAEAFLIAANRIGERGGWNQPILEQVLADLAKGGTELLAGVGFDLADVDEMITKLAQGNGTGADVDEIPDDPPAIAIYVQSGDLWELGAHRLLVGDSTKDSDVELVLEPLEGKPVDAVITDPPYAIYGSSTGIGADIADDKMVRPFFEAIGKLIASRLKKFGHAYAFTDWRSWAAMWEGFKRAGLVPKNGLVWDKGGGGLGSNWANAYELIAYFAKLPPPVAMQSGTERGQRPVHKANILRHSRPSGAEREHNAAKPVGLLIELVEAATDKGETIFEPFTGSGSTMIAGEKTGRRVFGLEIEPRFAQVAIERWQRITGQKAKRLK